MMAKKTLAAAIAQTVVGGGGLLLAAAALAQQPPAEPTAAETLDRVVVTAQSREQELKDVPIAVQVVDSRQIEQLAAVDIGDLDVFVPGLVVGDNSPTQPRYSIRGITTGDFGVGTDPAVGVYLDGVYAARSGGALLAFNDVQRIEVLKGPQGTLFGRNSAAGAIAIVSNRPSDEREGWARLRAGNDGREYLSGLINLPVGDVNALRASALSNRSDGWLDDAATGQTSYGDDVLAARLGWRSRLGDDTVLDLTYDREQLDQLARPAIGLIAEGAGTAPIPYPADPDSYLDPLRAPLLNDVVGNEESRAFDGLTLQIDHSFSWGNLLSTTALREFDSVNREDEDGTARIDVYFDTANIESNRSVYQEFKFNGNAGDVDWVAGVSWHQEDADQTSQTTAFSDSIDTLVRNVIRPPTPDGTLFSFLDQVLQANGIPATLLGHRWTEAMTNRGEYRSAALFGDAIWHVNDRLNLTFGLRYSHDSKDFSWFNGRRDAPTLDATLAALAQAGFFDQVGLPVEMLMFDAVFDFGALEGQRVTSSDSWSDFSPRFVVDYALSEQSMVFASLAKGYKAGGYNSVQPLSYFDNEEVWNLETGIKSEFDRLSVAASLFHYVYDNRQAIRLDPNTAGSGIPRYLVDISDEEAWGLDLALGWQVSEALRLRFDGAFIDAQFKDKLAPSGADLSGEPTGEPYLSLSTGGNYRWDLAANGALELSLMHAYRGKARCNADSRLQGDCQVSPNFSVGRAQQRTDLRLQWRSADGRWELGLYGNNVFDKRYVTDVNNLTTDVFGTPFANISPPRSYGVELKVAL